MLSQVATLEVTGGPAVIDRLNRSRNINFEVELSGAPLGGRGTAAVANCPACKTCPPVSNNSRWATPKSWTSCLPALAWPC